jgi:AraC family transcriptional regulator
MLPLYLLPVPDMNLASVYNTKTFVEQHYNEPIDVRDLERVSFYSYRNLQRIFKYTCGETIGAYQQRLKVENAYKMILYSKASLQDIALAVGFDNSASFSKAFKLNFGISPREARNGKGILFEQHDKVPVFSDEPLTPEVLYLPPTLIYYESTNTFYINEAIEALWDNFLMHDFPEKGTAFYGVIADEPMITDKIKCRYDAGASVQTLDKNLQQKHILGGKYARFVHKGGYDSIDLLYKRIYAGWILETKLEFDHSPIIEHYIKHASNTANEADFVTEILIPLKKK